MIKSLTRSLTQSLTRPLLILVAVFGLSLTLFAQTTATVQWNQAEPPAIAQAFTYSITIDTAAAVTLQPNCTAVNSITTCSASLSNYVAGIHNVILKASNANGSASAVFTTGAGPSVPGNSKIIVIIIG